MAIKLNEQDLTFLNGVRSVFSRVNNGLDSLINYLDQTISEIRNMRKLKEQYESIKKSLGKEYRINPNVTIEEAINQIEQDLDLSLLGYDKNYAADRIDQFQSALDNMGLRSGCNIKLVEYLPREYLSK
mgnify:CR=1 FL=1